MVMGGSLNYEKDSYSKTKVNASYFNGLTMSNAGDFPNCKDLYPDCPDNPSLVDNKCRNCPKTDELPKPKLEWVDCEYCGEDAVPVDSSSKKEENEDTKCHVCDKVNLKEYIAKQRK